MIITNKKMNKESNGYKTLEAKGLSEKQIQTVVNGITAKVSKGLKLDGEKSLLELLNACGFKCDKDYLPYFSTFKMVKKAYGKSDKPTTRSLPYAHERLLESLINFDKLDTCSAIHDFRVEILPYNVGEYYEEQREDGGFNAYDGVGKVSFTTVKNEAGEADEPLTILGFVKLAKKGSEHDKIRYSGVWKYLSKEQKKELKKDTAIDSVKSEIVNLTASAFDDLDF